ncbi:hypothetical protein NM688_g1721 [Phlebia brevispora]|uniref:Uncharacterized protein n=1 Tax=Phlebia brevispora TaxID=194682 RepID=A0ACC1TAI1_9APHY|nr:hypothetical protein NM688_g1721 [Phlebia brevispora]
MDEYKDLESAEDYKNTQITITESSDSEHAALLTGQNSKHDEDDPRHTSHHSLLWNARLYLAVAFVSGVFLTVVVQVIICAARHNGSTPPRLGTLPTEAVEIYAPPYAGSSEVHKFPPAKPTNVFPSLFPTDVGHAGPTPTGAEPGLIATAPAYPVHSGAPHLVSPYSVNKNASSSSFDLFRHWGNLSPWFSVSRGSFGLHSSPEAPDTCSVTALHLLHRHGARYPTQFASYAGPANFSARLNKAAAGWNASGELAFMNEWTYKLGEEVLTPFGRQQLYDLGVSTRIKYGFLLKNFTDTNTIPIFRTESQDRMLSSALNFAIGFFGYPFEGQYQQSITIEAGGYNNTLAPYKTCPNAEIKSKSDRGLWYVQKWAAVYLKDALDRLKPQMHGYELTIEDVYALQQMCAYETVAIGYSKFCELFTEEEWVGFDYSLDLYFWYDSAFGSPVARVQGIGYIQEMVARLTHTPIAVHNSSTNATLDDSTATFPLGQSLYVDATHEVVVLNILTALNLTNLAASGPLPADHIPPNRSFKVSHLAPFATNVHFQLLSCGSFPDPQIRIIVNDGVVPLTSIKGCPIQKDGLCPVSTFVAAMKEMIRDTDWTWGCHGGWETIRGCSARRELARVVRRRRSAQGLKLLIILILLLTTTAYDLSRQHQPALGRRAQRRPNYTQNQPTGLAEVLSMSSSVLSSCRSTKLDRPLRTRRGFTASARRFTHYQTLSVPRNATRSQIKASQTAEIPHEFADRYAQTSFYKLSKQYHPDLTADPSTKETFQKISEAYAVLGDDRKRRAYDRSLAENVGHARHPSSSSAFHTHYADPSWHTKRVGGRVRLTLGKTHDDRELEVSTMAHLRGNMPIRGRLPNLKQADTTRVSTPSRPHMSIRRRASLSGHP